MATLEEQLQNLIQEVNPMGSGVMSDQDVERVMQATSSDPMQSQFQNLIGDFRTETDGPGS